MSSSETEHSIGIRFHLLILAGICILTTGSYWPVNDATLLAWDTQKYTIDNTAIHSINVESLRWMLSETYHANWHPLTLLSHAIDIQLFGFNPRGHHWVNIIWHIACAFVLYCYSPLLLRELLGENRRENNRLIGWSSAVAALLFAVHPQHVESVAWVAERKDVLCGFFYLLSLLLYHYYVKADSRKHATLFYSISWLCAALATLAKPMAVSLPLILLLFDLLLYKRIAVTRWRDSDWANIARAIVLEKIPFILLAILAITLTFKGQTEAGAVGSTVFIPITLRISVSLTNWVNYISSFALPLEQSPFYPYPSTVALTQLISSTAIIVFLFGLAEYARRRNNNWPMLTLGFYSITLLPVIGLVQVGAIKAADRYAYIPTIPFYLITATLLILALCKLKPSGRKTLLPLSVTALLLLLSTMTHDYSKVWRNDIVLWEYVKVQHPDVLHVVTYLAEAHYAAANYDKALPLYRRAFSNRAQLQEEHILNQFIVRYVDVASRMGEHQEALIAMHRAWQEKRALGISQADIYFNAAQLNRRMAQHDEALKLIRWAIESGYTPIERARKVEQLIEQEKRKPSRP